MKADNIAHPTQINHDLTQKLSECIVRYKGVPYYTRTNGSTVHLYELHKIDSGAVHAIDYKDEHLDVSSVPLGYVNIKPYESVAYILRNPIRRVKQGICPNNTHSKAALGIHSVFPRNGVLFSKAFVDSVTGVFPPLQTALDKLRSLNESGSTEKHPIAISRDIGLVIDQQGLIGVYYKEEYVGWMPPNENLVMVNGKKNLGWIVSKYLSPHVGWNVV